MKTKYLLLTLILTFFAVSTTNVDAFSIFGKELNFGNIFSKKIKSAEPVSSIVDSRVNFEVTYPKKNQNLIAGNIVNITWKTSDKIDSYSLILEGSKNINLGKAYNKGKTFSWLIPKDIKRGNYKLSFVDKYGNKYKSETFDIVAPVVEIPKYQLELISSSVGLNETYRIFEHRLTFSGDISKSSIKLTCPKGISFKDSAKSVQEKCNTTIPVSEFGKSNSAIAKFVLASIVTNTTASANIVTSEFFDGTKSLGKVVAKVDPTRPLSVDTPIFIPILTNATVIKNSNVDMAVTANVKIDIQAEGGDIMANSVSAVIGLKDLKTGNILSTGVVNGVTEVGTVYVQEGSRRQFDFSGVFDSSVFPVGVTNVTVFVKSISYKRPASNELFTVTNYMDILGGGTATFEKKSSGGTWFGRNLTVGSVGNDVIQLRQFFISNGFLDPAINSTSSNYFGPEMKDVVARFQSANGISPADGYFGPVTRTAVQSKTIIIREN